MRTEPVQQMAAWLWRDLGVIGAFNLLLVLWLVLKPGSHAAFITVDNVAQALGPLLLALLCLLGGRRGRLTHIGSAQRWVPSLLGVGALCYAGGQIIFTVYELLRHFGSPPFPSWADPVYLSAYPFLLLGILLLPGRRLPVAARLRVLLDGLMVMTAVVTFSWYFILGPTIAQGGDTLLAAVTGLAYPLGDLVLIVCLLVLWSRLDERDLRPVVWLLSGAMGIIVVTDTVYDYQNLHGGYSTGGLLDAGWPLGYMLVALGGYAERRALDTRVLLASAPVRHEPEVAAPAPPDRPPGLWSSLLPSALVPAVGALLLYTHFAGTTGQYDVGVLVGAMLLIAIIVLRQVLTIAENRRLYARLDAAYAAQGLELVQNQKQRY